MKANLNSQDVNEVCVRACVCVCVYLFMCAWVCMCKHACMLVRQQLVA